MGVEAKIGDLNKVGCLSNLMAIGTQSNELYLYQTKLLL
jgi:hypothetical protein